MDYSYIKALKAASNRANKFFKSKSKSLNIDTHSFVDNYIDILKSHTLLILDTETTGLRNIDKMKQICIRVVKDYQEIDKLYETFGPKYEETVTHIKNKKVIDLDDYIPVQKINDFLKKYCNSVVVAHNISFDVYHCEAEGIIFPEDCYYFDTMWIITTKLMSMYKFCIFNDIDCKTESQHDADYDTLLLRDCIIHWLKNYIQPISVSKSSMLTCIVEYLNDPTKYNSSSFKCKNNIKHSELLKKLNIPERTENECIEILKQRGYTIKKCGEYINNTKSYYCVVITGTKCYITYNYEGKTKHINSNNKYLNIHTNYSSLDEYNSSDSNENNSEIKYNAEYKPKLNFIHNTEFDSDYD